MKKSILILCACAAFVCCTEDDLVVRKPAIPGSEVQFGATAYMSDGSSTRTEYGDSAQGKIELRWVVGDKIDIACPQAAAGRRKAAYEIKNSTIVKDNPDEAGKGTATQLEKLGEYGIQWGESGKHFFYALYPSSKSFTDSERGEIGMDGTGVNGYLPVNQDPKGVDTVKVDGKKNYILKPDMRYAFMVAKDSVDSRVDGATGVSLHFRPLVTALTFDLTAPDITNNTTEPTDLTITAVSLYSVSEQNICGSFQYKFQTDSIKDTNKGTGFSRITQTIPASDPVVLNSETKNKVDVTFFVLPSANMAKKDLRLQVFYTYNGSPYVRTLVIGKELTARKKYYFRNVKLPDIKANVQGSTWFSALDPNVYISQLSIPVAGNTFSNYYSGADSAYYQEQTLNYIQLWNKGVRGFEFSTAHGKTNFDNSTSGTLENNRFVCNGKAMNVTSNGKAITFGNAFRALTTALAKDSNECLIVICNYKTYAKSDTQMTGNDCQQYVKDLEAWLTANDTIKKRLVKLTPNSTVGDLRGKIAIIVRPGEDAYSSILTDSIKVTNSNLTLVRDWGTSVDKWNRRFGDSYMCEGAFNTPNKTRIENYLWATGSGSKEPYNHSTYGPDFLSGYPTKNSFSFNHTTNTEGQTVHVQEWARIIPSKSFATKAFYSGLSANHATGILQWGHDTYLWLKWPESYSQKQAMIEETVTASMDSKGGSTVNTLFINSLCGYYPVKELPASYYPYNTSYTYKCLGSHNVSDHSPSFSLDKAGAGGDYVACAYDLNKWFYKFLTEENKDGNVLKQGPLGLVMLNHIGTTNTTDRADDKSLDLVNWIMMNNFKFPLATKPSEKVQGGGVGQGGANTGGDAE